MRPADEVVTAMTTEATALLSALTEEQTDATVYPLMHPTRTRWEYRPRPRPGLALLDLDRAARKAAHRLLATALSRHAFAQAVSIMAWEEVLDLDEGGRRGRYSDDYRAVVFGTPGDEAWAWRVEGHHLSVTATITGDTVTVAPLFLGANPARVRHDDRLVLAPLNAEEEMARALMNRLSPSLRAEAIVAETAPADIKTGIGPYVDGTLVPVGVRSAMLPSEARELLGRLTGLYVDRLTPALADRDRSRLDAMECTFAWEGGPSTGEGCYYRIQAPGLLIEYDNTQNAANHAHTVLRRPGADFGAHLLAAHLAGEAGDQAVRR